MQRFIKTFLSGDKSSKRGSRGGGKRDVEFGDVKVDICDECVPLVALWLPLRLSRRRVDGVPPDGIEGRERGEESARVYARRTREARQDAPRETRGEAETRVEVGRVQRGDEDVRNLWIGVVRDVGEHRRLHLCGIRRRGDRDVLRRLLRAEF